MGLRNLPLTGFAVFLGAGFLLVLTLQSQAKNPTEAAPNQKLRVVIFGGHPDDPESGCGGLIAMLTKSGHEVLVAYATSFRGTRKIGGEAEAVVRRREATEACKLLGATPHFFDFAHEKLQSDEGTLKTISTWLKNVKPNVVVTHWPVDTHPNHHVTSSLVWQSYLQGSAWSLYFFEVMTDQQTLNFKPDLYLDIEGVVEIKKKALACHKSQDPDAIWKVHEAMARQRGSECGVTLAEAYTLVRPAKDRPTLPVRFLSRGMAQGPLRVHPKNPRYFTDGSGKAVFLTGSHTWSNFQDYTYATLPSPPAMDFKAYLAFLRAHNHNFIRLWVWESPFNPNAKQGTIYYDPMPYQRPGPGTALDGKPKFDLRVFNQAYFDRLRHRVQDARDQGIYVSVMLFQGFSIEGKGNVGGDPWQGHPFNPKNNVNDFDGGGSTGVHTLANRALTAHQESYVRKVIETVNDLNNVFYEITNEDTASPADTAWQTHFIKFINGVEATKPKQHPVGMTAQWPGGNDSTLLDSPATWISPSAKLLTGDGRKVILNDTDHSYFWIGLKADGIAAQRAWVWESFTRGNQCLFMDPYLDPSHDPGRNNPVGGKPDAYWDTLRKAMGRTRSYAMRMDLAAMIPHDELASTKNCLANPGQEYLLYLPKGGEITVDFSKVSGTFRVEWMHPAEGTTSTGEAITSGAKRTLKAPFSGDAVLFIERK